MIYNHRRIVCKILLACSLSFTQIFCEQPTCDKKILICGVCKNNESAVANTIRNIEKIGNQFLDYSVIIYENNSSDQTADLYTNWAASNPKVDFISEFLPQNSLPLYREECIARARNIVLERARDSKYEDFEYILWADLDFKAPWPIREIVNSVNATFEWDCISANGIIFNRCYYDQYAFRDRGRPFGPEIIGSRFWAEWGDNCYHIEGTKLVSVYSAFGGLAIYKRKSILSSAYSGTTTKDYAEFYKGLMLKLSASNLNVLKYLKSLGLKQTFDLTQLHLPEGEICCEHVTLHATMALNGYGKIFVNPKMYMYYQLER